MNSTFRSAQAGMILVTTVMMILLLTVLVIVSLKSVLLFMKVSNQIMAAHQDNQALEKVALELAAHSYDVYPATCRLNEVNPNEILGFLDNTGCTFKQGQQNYQYIIDDLGLYPCLPIDVGGKLFSSHHWLISVAAKGRRPVYLQIRMAKADKALPCESLDRRVIQSGVVSWCQFASR